MSALQSCGENISQTVELNWALSVAARLEWAVRDGALDDHGEGGGCVDVHVLRRGRLDKLPDSGKEAKELVQINKHFRDVPKPALNHVCSFETCPY